MKRPTTLVAALLLALAAPALANGGIARVVRAPVGPWFVTVYSSPTPLRTGELDISVLVQDSADAVLDVPVTVAATALDTTAAPVRMAATRGQATNKLFKAAKFDVAAPGRWAFEVEVAGGVVRFEADVARSTLLDRPFLLAIMALLPVLVVGWLVRRQGVADGGEGAPSS